MFFGSFQHSLDDKNRLVIPRKFRSELTSKLYIMKGFDGALSIFKEDRFLKLVDEFNSLPFSKKNARDYLRVQLASCSELEVDKLGRVILPNNLLTKYEIGKDVLIIGVGDHLEIWDIAKYEEYAKKAEDSFEDIAESLND